jgi:hypothetical protein
VIWPFSARALPENEATAAPTIAMLVRMNNHDAFHGRHSYELVATGSDRRMSAQSADKIFMFGKSGLGGVVILTVRGDGKDNRRGGDDVPRAVVLSRPHQCQRRGSHSEIAKLPLSY